MIASASLMRFLREIFSRSAFTVEKYHRERILRYEKITQTRFTMQDFVLIIPLNSIRGDTLQKWHRHPGIEKKTLFLPLPLVRRPGELTSKISIESQHNSNRRYDDNSLAATDGTLFTKYTWERGGEKNSLKGVPGNVEEISLRRKSWKRNREIEKRERERKAQHRTLGRRNRGINSK